MDIYVFTHKNKDSTTLLHVQYVLHDLNIQQNVEKKESCNLNLTPLNRIQNDNIRVEIYFKIFHVLVGM